MGLLKHLALLTGFAIGVLAAPRLLDFSPWLFVVLVGAGLAVVSVMRARRRTKTADREVGQRWFPP
jgi:F0F1-type ATP synthase assembly protein I